MEYPIVLRTDDIYDGFVNKGVFVKEEFDILFDIQGDNVILRNVNIAHPLKDFNRVIRVNGKNCKIDNCSFTDFDVNGPIIVLERKERLEMADKLTITNCLFMNGRKTEKTNGNEAIRLGWSGSSLSFRGMNIIHNNRFENYDREIEVISVKCNDNILVNNEFINCAGTLTLRHGNDSIVAFNKFDGKMKNNSGGIRVSGESHMIVNNVLQNIKGNGTTRCGISLNCGVENSPLNKYKQIKNCLIVENRFVNCNDVFAIGVEKKEANLKPRELTINNNYFNKCKNIKSKNKDVIGGDNVSFFDNKIDSKDVNMELKNFSLGGFDIIKEEIINYEEEKTDTEEEEEESNENTDMKKFIDMFNKKTDIKMEMKLLMEEGEDIQKDLRENLRKMSLLFNKLKTL